MDSYNYNYDPTDVGSEMWSGSPEDEVPTMNFGGGANKVSPSYSPPGFSPMAGIGEVPGYSRVQIPFAQGAEARTFSGAIRNGLAMKSLMQNRAAEIQQSQVQGKMQQMKYYSDMADKAASNGDFTTASILTSHITGKQVDPEEVKRNYLKAHVRGNAMVGSEMLKQGMIRQYGEAHDWTEQQIAAGEKSFEINREHEKQTRLAEIEARGSVAESKNLEDIAWKRYKADEAAAKATVAAGKSMRVKSVMGLESLSREGLAMVERGEKAAREASERYMKRKEAMESIREEQPTEEEAPASPVTAPTALPEKFPSSVEELQKAVGKGKTVTQDIYDKMKKTWMERRGKK